mmetsp:Transcript_39993/g.92794  ORF Transcript_39993/g.92794 Transcript_39993/m.92794 type:complete len:86 (-) Transcript_39993:56-313(-)
MSSSAPAATQSMAPAAIKSTVTSQGDGGKPTPDNPDEELMRRHTLILETEFFSPPPQPEPVREQPDFAARVARRRQAVRRWLQEE